MNEGGILGRSQELRALQDVLGRVTGGQGAAVMVAGEAGIGKTSLLDEFALTARASGAIVLRGVCMQEWALPYGPFTEALTPYVRDVGEAELRADVGGGAPTIGRLVPAVRERLPDTPEPADLSPGEERIRLFDAVGQFTLAIAARAPLVLVIDDLHWADSETLSMLRQVVRASREARVMVVGAFRDTEVGDGHPAARTLSALRRETELAVVPVGGLGRDFVRQLLERATDGEVAERLVTTVFDETTGNPFFVTQIAAHLADSGAALDETNAATVDSIAELGIPATVREAVQNRLARLSERTRALLTAASGFGGPFPLAVAASAADLPEETAVGLVDEALAAQMLRPDVELDSYDFTHALVRHAIYDGLNPSRRVRLHRRVAEAAESYYGDRSSEHAALLVYQYEQSATLPGAERGADYALDGARSANHVYAWHEGERFLRAALRLMSQDDPRRVRITATLARTVVFTSGLDAAEPLLGSAADMIAEESGRQAAAEYLAGAVLDLASLGSPAGPGRIAEKGLEFSGDVRDYTWVCLQQTALIRRDAEDPTFPGIELRSPERIEMSDVIRQLSAGDREKVAHLILFDTRQELLDYLGDSGYETPALRSGRFRACLPAFELGGKRLESMGRLGMASSVYSLATRLRIALGDFAEATANFDRARELARRLPLNSNPVGNLSEARMHRIFAMGEGWDRLAPRSEMFLMAVPPRGRAATRASTAQTYAELGRTEEALSLLTETVPAIERGHQSTDYYPLVSLAAAEVLWILERRDHIEVIERNIREKMIASDFRYTMRDARRSMGHLCALQGRHEEAREWFAKARVSCEEDGQRPMRALVDFDEALMWVRRGRRGDRERASDLVTAALAQFEALGMTGWAARARDLSSSTRPSFPDGLTGREVEVLRLIAAGRTNREISDDLVLSQRTVARHITNIYTKIGAANKADATTYAIKHGLKND